MLPRLCALFRFISSFVASLSGRTTGPMAASDSDSWDGMTVVQLRAVLKEHGLTVSGKKADLVKRLVENTKPS